MGIWKELFGLDDEPVVDNRIGWNNDTDKRRNEQKEAFSQRAKEHAAWVKRAEQVQAEVAAATPAEFARYQALEAEDMAGWSFSCRRNADFLVMRWTRGGRNHAHALNLSQVVDVQIRAGESAAETGGMVRYNETRWEFCPRQSNFAGGRSTYWRYELNAGPAPALAYDAVVTFKGVDFVFGIPPSLANAAYDAIMDAIAGETE